jgi:hypothetical protein
MIWIGLIWLRIGTSGGLLWTWQWTSFRFHKMLGSSWVTAQLTASQEGLSSMSEWVSEWVLTVMSANDTPSSSQSNKHISINKPRLVHQVQKAPYTMRDILHRVLWTDISVALRHTPICLTSWSLNTGIPLNPIQLSIIRISNNFQVTDIFNISSTFYRVKLQPNSENFKRIIKKKVKENLSEPFSLQWN